MTEQGPGSAVPGAQAPGTAGPQKADICLVSMPYSMLSMPSLALGLLKSILESDGIATTVLPAYLKFAEQVGIRRYGACSSGSAPTVFLMGEWTFAGAAFGDDPRREAKDAEYVKQVAMAAQQRRLFDLPAGDARIADDLWALREAATAFVDQVAAEALATGAKIVGCTSTFEQHVASLAVLRRISELDPDVVTMIGGANCETVMGEATHRCFPWVDYVVSGEADGVIAKLVRGILNKDTADLPPGVLGPAHRNGTGVRSMPGQRAKVVPRAIFSDLDSLPTPDFTEYFKALETSSLREQIRPGLPMESSRGCWWGAVHHCTFCGLNGTSMAFRAKSPDRVLDELHELEEKYQISDFEMVDNILDMDYCSSLLPKLAEDGKPRRIFYEIKANLSKTQVETLARSGVRWVQPGIENLHTEVLRLMDKGIQGWQNVRLLKWGREFGVRVYWSLLWGFPGEKNDWYEEMAGWLPALEHLQPPSGPIQLRYDRYSVYHEQAKKRGLVLFPVGSMAMIYPVYPADLDRLGYYFSTEPSAGPVRLTQHAAAELKKNPGVEAVFKGVLAWKAAHGRSREPVLWLADDGVKVTVTDTRSCATKAKHVLSGLDRAVLLACQQAPRPGKLAKLLGNGVTEDEIAPAVDRLVSDLLVLPMDGRLVGLALDDCPPPPIPANWQFPGGHVSAPGSSAHGSAAAGSSALGSKVPAESR